MIAHPIATLTLEIVKERHTVGRRLKQSPKDILDQEIGEDIPNPGQPALSLAARARGKTPRERNETKDHVHDLR
jgi:hypothetical protein